MLPACSRRRWRWLRPQFGDQPQDLGEHHLRHGDLGHLESDIAAVADELGADLDQLLPQAGQRPLFDLLRCRQRAQEVAEIVGELMKLKPDGGGSERPALFPVSAYGTKQADCLRDRSSNAHQDATDRAMKDIRCKTRFAIVRAGCNKPPLPARSRHLSRCG